MEERAAAAFHEAREIEERVIGRRERELEEREKGIRELLSDALDQAKESLARTASTEYTDVEPEKQSGHFGLGILLSHV